MGGGGHYAAREEIALVPTPEATSSWKPVPHYEVIEAVTEVVQAHQWVILECIHSIFNRLFYALKSSEPRLKIYSAVSYDIDMFLFHSTLCQIFQ